ncbi:sensor histidine kinase [Paenibacillus pinistramenti]|uniref:sensor histidine kinase n=1 Tax=Paenibacillus pinistramenti TaxID=1768003 RepID=UPI001EEFF7B2|nr:HAMP domain-containing sensor histidine kinase [Paenibacillus pinistramenti]
MSGQDRDGYRDKPERPGRPDRPERPARPERLERPAHGVRGLGPSDADIQRRINRKKVNLEQRQAQEEQRRQHAQRQRDPQTFSNDMHEKFMKLMRVAGILLLLTLCWVAGYYVLNSVYRLTGWQPARLPAQLLTSMLGMFFWGIAVSILSRVARDQQRYYYQQMLDALRRISRGDFQVDLGNLDGLGNHPFNELASSVNEMAANLKNTEDMRQEFISNVSHEIQSPLTSIAGFARVLKQEELDRGQALHYLDIIEQESARLSKLSDSMLRLASLDSRQLELQTERFRLDKQLQLQVLSCEPQWLEKNIEMDAELKPVEMEADQNLLSQVWVNLLHNAVKFTPPGGTVRISLSASDSEAVISVQDTGIGIAEENLPHIFERFYKADRSRARHEGGNGLGLSILQKIVELHHGEVSVTSQLGEGTEFIVRLPLRQSGTS